MQSTMLCLPFVGLAGIAVIYVTTVFYQQRDLRLRRLHNATLEFAHGLGIYECRAFLEVAQTGDQVELGRRWPAWPEFRDATLRGDYRWGAA
ncbi:hypothetical protein [Rhizobium sp. BK602]|uniref:hypothetical protein n=1 Tax=Rhizobium sp. BK602 TaxID=2586986 RepID=UPI0016099D4E|nr:hypothetical protein [Rhizobium sp. BK602]MBB3608632.1 hypothetical protein [Rhizobium sp. BK602]